MLHPLPSLFHLLPASVRHLRLYALVLLRLQVQVAVLLYLVGEHDPVLSSLYPGRFWFVLDVLHSEAGQELLILRVLDFVDLRMRHGDEELEFYAGVLFVMEVIADHEGLATKSNLVLSSF